MRLLILSAAAAVLATAILPLAAESASHGRYRQYAYAPSSYGTRPYWQGTPTDRLPIWRYGYYQGNDPDNFIRSQLMRDPKIPYK
ncbi:MAG TPA: hypothetical protein VKP67_05445 [Xanthobacteraceae bacterium]|nr:hypothetical protein [Xanthobacteraceae bacterium]